MKAVFLCGGIGKRMFPITEDKFLLNFVGKTLLEHQIDIAKQAGFRQILIIGNPANIEQIEQIVKTISDIKIDLALQKRPLGIADALQSAETSLGGDIIVVNPNDVFTARAYTDLLQAAKRKSSASYMLGYKVEEYFPGGYLAVDAANMLQHIVEKPKPGHEPSNLVNILVHLHSEPEKLMEYIEKAETSNDDVYECAIDNMVKEGYKVQIVPHADFWAPIKYPWHIFSVVKHFLGLSQPLIAASAYISEKATIDGEVIISDNVRVLENAVIRGPAYIGPNSIIGNNALIRDHSHIGADCVIGHCTEVKNSYIGDGCWFHSNYIGDSIIGRNCSFGAGTVLANFRFDEQTVSAKIAGQLMDTGRDKLGAIIGDNSKTGINASVMPGRKIGPNSIVGSHVCLTEDLEPGKMILTKPQYETAPNLLQLDEAKKIQRRRKLS